MSNSEVKKKLHGVERLRLPELPDLSGDADVTATHIGPESSGNEVTVEAQLPLPQEGDADQDDTCPWQQCCPEWEGPVHCITDWKEAERRYDARFPLVDMNEQRRLKNVMTCLRERGPYRKLMTIPRNWRRMLQALNEEFPNFSEVVEYLEVMCALSAHRDKVFRFDPILLNGQPGCGKTYFAERLAGLIGSGSNVIRMETAQSNAVLAGSADFWSNTKPGQTFTLLVEKDWANPCMILDEIEKCTSRDFDPTMALLSLLEPSTARKFTDLSYPWLTLDASTILWICTSNDADLLPLPVLDRCRRFEIGPMLDFEARVLIQRLFDQEIAELMPGTNAPKLSKAVVEQLVGLSPRRVKRVVREAVGRALYDGRRRVLPRDVVVDSVEDDAQRPKIGFT
ncbi:MAG TPA: AAA family ATPase [Clostridia bacterium]|nr:AAA family ATPase [Clostridia bacterium]